ncbi:GNAT family N-acetyltransferase [Desulfobaculum sp.]
MHAQHITIRPTTDADFKTIFAIHSAAFGQEDEARLTLNLLRDPSAAPRCSLLAFDGDRAVGHILFTKVTISGSDARAAILAPLAVLPQAQRQGIGGQLIQTGLHHLKDMNFGFVFVLGHIEYYPKHGFVPAYPFGLYPPYPIPKEMQDGWMVQSLGIELGTVQGSITCANELDKLEYWSE